MVRLARKAEAAGFESVWVAETRMTRDAVAPVAAIAAATERIKVGTGIVNVFTRGPVVIAITFASLEEIAPGRIVMGLGTGSPLVLAPQGQRFEKPLTRLREYVEVIRPLLRGEEVTYVGQAVSLEGARIEDLLAETGALASSAGKLPLYLGVTGPRALELAGEIADGVLLNVALPTAYVERALDSIARGAQRTGRSPAEVDVAMAIAFSPHGKDAARRFLALYLSMFPNIARETGLPEQLLAGIRKALEEEGLEHAARLVGDDAVDALCAAGTPEECRARLDEYRRAGVALPVLVPLEGAIAATIEALA
jgi:5,10-methylenetetrahydromethanopterin reductase